jgi:hypothetical protein
MIWRHWGIVVFDYLQFPSYVTAALAAHPQGLLDVRRHITSSKASPSVGGFDVGVEQTQIV